MRTWRILLIGLGAIVLSSSFTVASVQANTQNSSPWLLYQAAINAQAPQSTFPWDLFNAAIKTAKPKKRTLIKEEGIWWGWHNGGRPTFYFRHLMMDYPPTFRLVQAGCEDVTVINNGHRFTTKYIIVKQSDVPGRGMALTNQSGQCTKSTKSYIEYYQEEMPRENPPFFKY
jgi:hypothetical protein